jgi:hypothetical protein
LKEYLIVFPRADSFQYGVSDNALTERGHVTVKSYSVWLKKNCGPFVCCPKRRQDAIDDLKNCTGHRMIPHLVTSLNISANR